ncbi:DNA methyltransferase domain protein [Streptomyces phage Samy]|nr:DNA methyltransferase domain protein [Streptomyces phage Samy]
MVVHLLPTPTAADARGTANFRADGTPYGSGYGPTLTDAVRVLLPTPTARDWKSGASNLHGRNSRPLNEVVLTLAEPTKFFGTPRASSANGPGRLDNPKNQSRLETQVVLLKTPTANLGTNGAAQHPDKRKAGGHGPTLDDEVTYLIPEPDGLVQDWGPYEPAIRRQEAWMDREAPIPTEVGPRGGRRLAARFAEWLMGLPDGWVTDTPGLSRGNQLHAIGNGVVPRQAYYAFKSLMEHQAHTEQHTEES